MITDDQCKALINEQWAVVEKLSRGSHRQAMASGVYINETPLDQHYNLPFFMAYAILDQVLTRLVEQNTFVCKDRNLGPMMEASRAALPWQDFVLVGRGKKARNDLAHRGVIAPKADCLAYIAAISNELKAWGILA